MPTAIVLPTVLDVDAYVAAGRQVEMDRPKCPGCTKAMRSWGWYKRDVRVSVDVVHRLEVRRVRCCICERSHGLLPDFVTWGPLDAVEAIGPAIETMCSGAGVRGVARALGLGRTTVRDWRRRLARRAGLLAMGFCRYIVAVGDLASRLSGHPEVVALAAATAAWHPAQRRFEGVGALWRLTNAVVGGHLLSTNKDPPWAAA